MIKKHLKRDGIFRDIFNKKNAFVLNLIKDYKEQFKYIDIYNGETSNKIFYKTFYNVDEVVYDVTNLILISSDKKFEVLNNFKLMDLTDYINDKVKQNNP